MRCLSCQALSASVICSECEKRFFSPVLTRRKAGTLDVVSLFAYSEIEPFLVTKHTPVGYRLYRFFGEKFVAPFVAEFAEQSQQELTLIGVDEHVRNGYAHTAVLTHAVHHRNVNVMHGRLRARTDVHYAGKTLHYRLEHPRRFIYTGSHGLNAILVDDVVTTGMTLQEAHHTLQRSGVHVLFALTLADAQH